MKQIDRRIGALEASSEAAAWRAYDNVPVREVPNWALKQRISHLSGIAVEDITTDVLRKLISETEARLEEIQNAHG